MSDYSKELTALANTLQVAYDGAELLPPELGAVKIRVQNSTRTLINFVNGLAGQGMVTHGKEESGPVKSIMGELISRPEPVTMETLKPDDYERQKFLEDRDHMYEQFLSLKDEQLYSKSKMPMGGNIIRAVAKKAGVQNYSDAEMNKIFFAAIRKAIQAEVDLKKSLDIAGDKLKTA